ncbi:hypothetical protein H5410_061706 [Solanum commersonii]|uniref:Uncharacterized protein n=1 Tax=Solanum commersonii TaxID=4109 RepID=A0A9J5W9L4_SOLCO|nr:hypothetical protein H5410_061706 [Solanum commersonii]
MTEGLQCATTMTALTAYQRYRGEEPLHGGLIDDPYHGPSTLPQAGLACFHMPHNRLWSPSRPVIGFREITLKEIVDLMNIQPSVMMIYELKSIHVCVN